MDMPEFTLRMDGTGYSVVVDKFYDLCYKKGTSKSYYNFCKTNCL